MMLLSSSRDAQNLARVNVEIGRLALRAAERLMDHDARMGQRVAPALRPASSSIAPMLAACPRHSVETGGLMNCIVS